MILMIGMIEVDKNDVPEYVVDAIIDMFRCVDIKDEDVYYDELHINIDERIVGSTGEAKEIVENYGVLKAIKLYKQEYGDFELDDDDNKVYMTLCYCIMREWFNTYYSYKELKKVE